MADRGVDVDRLHRIAAGAVDDVVHLRQLDEIAEVRLVSGTAAAVDIGAVGGRRDLGKEHRVAAELEIVRGVAGMHREARRRMADKFEDHVRVEAHALGVCANVGSMLLHDPPCLVMQHVDTDLLQHAERCEVDRFELVGGHDLGRRKAHLRLPERRLFEGGRSTRALSRPAAAACSIALGHRFGGWHRIGHRSLRLECGS